MRHYRELVELFISSQCNTAQMIRHRTKFNSLMITSIHDIYVRTSMTYCASSSSSQISPRYKAGIYGGANGSERRTSLSSWESPAWKCGVGREGFFWRAGQIRISNYKQTSWAVFESRKKTNQTVAKLSRFMILIWTKEGLTATPISLWVCMVEGKNSKSPPARACSKLSGNLWMISSADMLVLKALVDECNEG